MYNFSFVRHPFSRLVSAYQDKVVTKKGSVAQPVKDRFGPTPTFEQFVDFILDESQKNCRYNQVI